MKGNGEVPTEDLDEASSTTLGIDFLEALLFFPLLDNTERSDEETQDNGHETVNGRESVFKRVVREDSDGSNTETGRDVNGGQAVDDILGTKPANLGAIRPVEVSTAAELILEGDSVGGGQRQPLLVKFIPLPQGEEPDHTANNSDEDGIDN